jgi:gas vesicle protein
MKSEKFVLGLLAGIATGTLLGIFIAPDKGSATRKKIVKKGDKYADELKDKFNGYLDTLSEKIDSIKNEEYAENLKEKVNEIIEGISKKVKGIEADLSDLTDPKKAKSKKV